jgi:aryl-alcohol dehydrogenase-like predicted oxidoreductase
MQYAEIPGLEKKVSRLVQGSVMLKSREKDQGYALFDAVFEAGCNTFDTAHVYGNGDCERVLGSWINDRGIREKVVILDKGAHHNPDRKRVTPFDITADIHDSRARLKTDYIDLYLLHRDDPAVPAGPIAEVLNEHLRAGHIRAFGGSNWTAARIEEANTYAAEKGLTPFVAASPHFSLAGQIAEPWEDCVSITGAAGASDRAWYRETQFPLFCWSSLAGGWFSGRLTRENRAEHEDTLYMRCYGSEENFVRLERARELAAEKGCTLAQIALAWILNQPYNAFPLVAAYTPGEFADSAAALDIALTEAEIAWLNLEADDRA